jgi:DNA-binding protein H-NS
MARPKSLASMSVDALLQLRNDVSAALSKKAASLKDALASLGDDVAGIGRKMVRGRKSKLSGRKVAPKYRGPNGETWAGRGATPVWLRDAIKVGKKREDFLIAKSSATAPAPKKKKSSYGKKKKR